MPIYLDIGVVRIQEYIHRTAGSDSGPLSLRRGASAKVTEATSPGSFASMDLRENTETFRTEGVAHLTVADQTKVDPSLAEERLERAVTQVSDALPAAYVEGTWAVAADYPTAYEMMKRARRTWAVTETVPNAGRCARGPAVREDPVGRTCRSCGLSVVTHADSCADCRNRKAAGQRTLLTAEGSCIADLASRTGEGWVPVATLGDLAAMAATDGVKGNHLATVYADGNGMGALFASLSGKDSQDASKAAHEALTEAAGLAFASLGHLVPDRLATSGGKPFPGVVTTLAADDVLISVPAPWGWPFTTTLLKEFSREIERRRAAFTGVSTLPSLTAGLVFSHVKHPIEDAITRADGAMRLAKKRYGGAESAVGWLDLTAASGAALPYVAPLSMWTKGHATLAALDQVAPSQLARWRQMIERGRTEGREPAEILDLVRAQATRVNAEGGVPDTLVQLERLLAMARWRPSPNESRPEASGEVAS